MAVQHPRYPKEEVAQRGHQLYQSQIRDCCRRRQAVRVEAENYGKIVAIDLETGDFELAKDSLTAAKQLLIRYPTAKIFCIRIGHLAVHRIGYHRLVKSL